MAERIRVEITGDSKDLVKAAAAAAASIRTVSAEEKRAGATTRAATKDNERLTASLTGVGGAVNRTNRSFTFLRNTISVLKWPALVTGAGMAAQALSALTAGAMALVGALTPLAGALAAYPALGAAAAQGIGVTALATKGLGKAIEGDAEALAKLDAGTRRFVDLLRGKGKAVLDDLRDRARQGIFGGGRGERMFEDVLNPRSVRIFQRAVTDTAVTLGRVAEEASQLVGSKGFGRDLETISRRNVVNIDRLGRSGVNLADALRHVLVAAGPFVGWLTKGALELSRLAEAKAEAGRESGRLGRFFHETREAMVRVWNIAEPLAGAFFDVGRAAKPLGDTILRDLAGSARELERWTSSATGQRTLARYFQDAKAPLYEAGRLARDLVGTFFRLGNQPGVADLIRKVRVELLPVLEDMIAATTAGFGPAFTDLLIEAGRLFAMFAGVHAPLTVFVRLLTAAARVLNDLLSNNPALSTMAVTFVGLAGTVKAMQFAGAILGIKTLIGLYRKLTGAATTAAAATAATGGGAAAAGAGAAAGAAAGGLRGRLGRVAGATILGARVGPLGAAIGGTALIAPTIQRATQPRDRDTGLPTTGGGFRTFARDPIGSVLGNRGESGERDQRIREFGDAVNKLKDAAKATRPELARLVREAARLGPDFEKAKTPIAETRTRLIALQRTARQGLDLDLDVDIPTTKLRLFTSNVTHMRKHTTTTLGQMKSAFSQNMRIIETTIGTHSRRGKELLRTNLQAGMSSVRDLLRRGVISTRTAMREIETMTARYLKTYGFSSKQAGNEARGQRYDGGPQEGSAGPGGTGPNRPGMPEFAHGGVIGAANKSGTDKVPMQLMVGEGETHAILTRHQRSVAEQLLAPVGGLSGLISTVNQKHSLPLARSLGNFARGGIVALGRQLQRQGYQVGEHPAFGGVGGGHAPQGFHPRGMAIDVNADGRPGGEAKWLDRLHARLRNMPGVVELLWRVANHFDHLHVAMSGGGGALGNLGLDAPKLRRVRVKGADEMGPYGRIAQGATDKVRAAAQDYLDRKLQSGIGGGQSHAGGQFSKAELADLWTQAGGARNVAPLMAAIALAESGGNPTAQGPVTSYGHRAGGLWQIHPPQPGWQDPLRNARMAVEKYRSQGLSAWEAYTNGNYRQYMAQGGLLEAARGLLAGAGAKRKAKDEPTLTERRRQRKQEEQAEKRGNLRGPKRERAEKQRLAQERRDRKRARGRLRRRDKRQQAMPEVSEAVYTSLEKAIEGKEFDLGFVEELYGATTLRNGQRVPGDEQYLLDTDGDPNTPDAVNWDGTLLDGKWIGGINAAVLEFQDQIGRNAEVAGMKGQLQDAALSILAQIHAAVTKRQALLKSLREKAIKNARRMRAIQERVKDINEAQAEDLLARRTKGKKGKRLSRGDRERLAGEERDLRREFGVLQRDQQDLTGAGPEDLSTALRSRTLNPPIQQLERWREGGRIGDVVEEIESYDEPRETYQAALPKIGDEIRRIRDITIPVLSQQIADATGTTPPKVSIEAGSADSGLAELIKEQLRATQESLRVSQAQFGVFRNLPYVGAFSHGADRVLETGLAVVHRDERITPDPQGPYGSQLVPGRSEPPQVSVYIDGDAAGLIKTVRAEIDGRAAEVVSVQQGRRARQIVNAPGGRRGRF